MKTKYGIDIDQFRTMVVRPVLHYLSMHSNAAENLLIGTALQESRLHYLHQLGGGPAIGVFQMEPATHDDIFENYLEYKAVLRGKVYGLQIPQSRPLNGNAAHMAGNLYYAAAMARVHYYRVPRALPGPDDVHGLAAYWKRWYNTPLGAGTVEEAIPHFQVACNP